MYMEGEADLEIISAINLVATHTPSPSFSVTCQLSLSSSLEEGGHLHLMLSGLCLSPPPPLTELREVEPG